MVTTSRQVIVNNTIILEIDLRDALGNRADADSQPEVEIIDSQGTVRRSLSSAHVSRLDVGRYRTTFAIPSNGPTGIWVDHWSATLNGFPTESRLNFIVLSQDANIGISGSQIGDDPNISYSEEEICGINILLAKLKARLNNNIESETLDEYGNTTYIECSVFTDEELLWFLECALSEFNMTPHFTDFTFDMPIIYDRFSYIIVESAVITSLLAKSLIEAGKEFTISDNGISITPPQLSSVMTNQTSQLISSHRENLKYIKNSIKPSPLGFGNFNLLNGANPAFRRLRHLRARRII